jgi:hypothetical protein
MEGATVVVVVVVDISAVFMGFLREEKQQCEFFNKEMSDTGERSAGRK